MGQGGSGSVPHSPQREDDRRVERLDQPGQPHSLVEQQQRHRTRSPQQQTSGRLLVGSLAHPSVGVMGVGHPRASSAGSLPLPAAAASALQDSGQAYAYYASPVAPGGYRAPAAGVAAAAQWQPPQLAQPPPPLQTILPAPPAALPAATVSVIAAATPRQEPLCSLPDLACRLVTAVDVERQWCGPQGHTTCLSQLYALQAIAGEAGVNWATDGSPNAMVAERLMVLFSKVKRQMQEPQTPLSNWFGRHLLRVIECRWASSVGMAPPNSDGNECPNIFAQGQKVHYFSSTHSSWVLGIVYGPCPGGGAYDLTCKAAAGVERIRPDPPLLSAAAQDAGTPLQQVVVPCHPVGNTGVMDFSSVAPGPEKAASSSRSSSRACSRAPASTPAPAPVVPGGDLPIGSLQIHAPPPPRASPPPPRHRRLDPYGSSAEPCQSFPAASRALSSSRAAAEQRAPQVTPAAGSRMMSPQRSASWREPTLSNDANCAYCCPGSPLRSTQSRIAAAPPPPAGWGFEASQQHLTERQLSEFPPTVPDIQALVAASVAYASDIQETVEIVSPPRSQSPAKQRGSPSRGRSRSNSPRKTGKLQVHSLTHESRGLSKERGLAPEQGLYAAGSAPGSSSSGCGLPPLSQQQQEQHRLLPAGAVQVLSRKLRETISNSPERRRRKAEPSSLSSQATKTPNNHNHSQPQHIQPPLQSSASAPSSSYAAAACEAPRGSPGDPCRYCGSPPPKGAQSSSISDLKGSLGSFTSRDAGSEACEEAALTARRLRVRCESFLQNCKAEAGSEGETTDVHALLFASELLPTTQMLHGGLWSPCFVRRQSSSSPTGLASPPGSARLLHNVTHALAPTPSPDRTAPATALGASTSIPTPGGRARLSVDYECARRGDLFK